MVSQPKQLVKVQIITGLLSVPDNQFSRSNPQNFAFIIGSIFGVSNSVTTRPAARYSSLGYRTVQRFYALKDVGWLMVNLLLFKHSAHKKGQGRLLAADETVKPKAGKRTHGLGGFYSSLAKRVIKSVSFLAISTIGIEKKKSCILGCDQLTVNNLDSNGDAEPETTSRRKKAGGGRPKGSKNKAKSEPSGTSCQVLKSPLPLAQSKLKTLLPELSCFRLVLDGFYGHHDYVLLAAEYGLNIVSKPKTNAHPTLPFEGRYAGAGRPRALGDGVRLTDIAGKFFVSTLEDKNSNASTGIYRFEAFTPKMSGLKLNVVVMVHTRQMTKRVSRNILSTNDLTPGALALINYYSLRFQAVRRCDRV